MPLVGGPRVAARVPFLSPQHRCNQPEQAYPSDKLPKLRSYRAHHFRPISTMLPMRVVVLGESVEALHEGKRLVREGNAEVADSCCEENPPAVAGAPESVVVNCVKRSIVMRSVKTHRRRMSCKGSFGFPNVRRSFGAPRRGPPPSPGQVCCRRFRLVRSPKPLQLRLELGSIRWMPVIVCAAEKAARRKRP